MKSFKSYLKEYGALDPFQPMGGSSSGPGMGQYVPSADLNLRASKQKIKYVKIKLRCVFEKKAKPKVSSSGIKYEKTKIN